MRRAIAVSLTALLLGAGLAAPGRALAEPEARLPNLFAYPPSWLIGPVTGELPDYDPTTQAAVVDGCLPEERALGAQRCLRFLTKLTNFDFAALRLALRVEPTGTNVYQVVEGEYLPAGTFSFDPVRGEVQVDDFYRVRMWRFDGRRKVGPPVASTGLRDLCPGFQHVPFVRQSCAAEFREGPRGPEQTISLPWLGVVWYPSSVAGQYVDITGVRDGDYVIEIQIDPKDHIRESYERDNRTCNVIRLRGTKVYELRNEFCWRRRT